jgi:hypothetical protein
MQSPASPVADARWARGGLARIIVDLLYEIGGAPAERGVTIDELTARVMDRPPAGVLYAAQRWYAVYIIGLRETPNNINEVIVDDGAQGIGILNGPSGKPWFTKAQAVRAYLHSRLTQASRQTTWLTRDGDRFRLASESEGPTVRGLGKYNAATRTRLDQFDRGHADYVYAKRAFEKIDEPELASLVLKHLVNGGHGDTYFRRRRDFARMIDAMEKLHDPKHQREFRAKLAERTVAG